MLQLARIFGVTVEELAGLAPTDPDKSEVMVRCIAVLEQLGHREQELVYNLIRDVERYHRDSSNS